MLGQLIINVKKPCVDLGYGDLIVVSGKLNEINSAIKIDCCLYSKDVGVKELFKTYDIDLLIIDNTVPRFMHKNI